MKNLLAPTLALLACFTATAQTDTATVAARVAAACPTMVTGLVADTSLAKATKQRPISVPAVCSCTTKRLETDEKLNSYLSSQTRDTGSESRNESLQAYLSLLAASSVYACLVPELEASKNAISLPG